MENGDYWSETDSQPADGGDASDSSPNDPHVIGRYRVVRRLGQGGFGRVYLAQDDELERRVAIKVPNPERVARPGDVEAYLAEARALARLENANIVPVYDVGRTDDGLCYVVSKFIEGSDLAGQLKKGRPTIRESAELAAVVASALHHAHTRGLVHRDIKPANILISTSNEPWVADFGLALKDEDYGKGARLAGTPAYMSPEQARGEGHRVDGRSDIFSLGVVLYELLAGRTPFRGESRTEVMDQIATSDPRPLRQIDDTIPRELERICQKAMAKRASERYSTGRDMADDLRHFLETDAANTTITTAPSTLRTPAPSTHEVSPPLPITGRSAGSDSDGQPVKIIPKGLRSFDRHDADFFLELLPGPRDRDGLPDSIRFWKTRIESTDQDATFRVALIYGPSGCGKSSLVKAGLLPRLAKRVLPVYVEATPGETEARLLKGVRKLCPDLPDRGNIVDALTALRRGRLVRPGEKVLLVIDQFEQWLFARRDESTPELVAALRQCDGEHIQAIVMVRDDFWMAATRFMRDLEIRLLEGENSAAVDLFDLLHARRVLTALGRAYGVLPEKSPDSTAEQRTFLEQSVAGLAQGGKVISVRLALFAEMVKGKPWTPATLKEVGGTQGVGVTFLDETFSATTAPPEHRLHQRAAQAILRALLPQSGTDIKGQMRSEAELREASGYESRPRDFDDVIGILDHELRLITPTDPEGSGAEVQATRAGGERYYQLTHDYLVHSLREWLTRKQRETRRGRAELRLEERAAIWDDKPENRHLPSLPEWVSIRTLSRQKDWTDPQRRMMRRAGKLHGLHTLGVGALIAALCWGGIEVYGNLRASALVESLKFANISDVPAIVGRISDYRRWADPRLRSLVQESDSSSREKLNASVALLPVDRAQLPFLEEKLLNASPSELPILRDAMRSHHADVAAKLWTVLESPKTAKFYLLRAAAALARYDPNNLNWQTAAEKVATALVTVNPIDLGTWLDAFRPVQGRLIPPLTTIFRDLERPEAEHILATNVLAEYGRDDPDLLAELLMSADANAFIRFLSMAGPQAEKILPLFRAELAKTAPTSATAPARADEALDRLAERKARAAIALIQMGKPEDVWIHLQHRSDPRLRSFIINWLKPMGTDPKFIVDEFGQREAAPHGPLIADEPTARRLPSDKTAPTTMPDILFHPQTSTRRALILALGTFGAEELSAGEPDQLANSLLDLYRNDVDAGIHGAVEWTLRQWKRHDQLKAIDADLSQLKHRGDRRWYVNGQGQTFSVVDQPVEFFFGSPENDLERVAASERVDRVSIARRFAVATKEVTLEQYRRFAHDNRKFDMEADTEQALRKYSPDPQGPWIGPSWYVAAAYCNWLSKVENLPEDQWCYVPNKAEEYAEGMMIPANALDRTGYRLPTEVEWEYACRAGAVTSRYYGVSVEQLGKYAWYLANSQGRAHPAGNLIPNDLGLFDMLGNVYEWCLDGDETRLTVANGVYGDLRHANEIVVDSRPRMFRGGTFMVFPAEIRSAHRNKEVPQYVGIYNGFRLARTFP